MSILNSDFIDCSVTTRLPILTTAQRDALTDVEVGTMIINSNLSVLQVYGPFGWVTLGRFGTWNASGGTIISSGGFNYHVFTTAGNFGITEFRGGTTLEVLIVGGGGGGGSGVPASTTASGGGGGGGGIAYVNDAFKTPGAYPVTIGFGGAGGVFGGAASANGTSSAVGFLFPGSIPSVVFVNGFGGGRGGTALGLGGPGGTVNPSIPASGGGGGSTQNGGQGFPFTYSIGTQAMPVQTFASNGGNGTSPLGGGGGGGAGNAGAVSNPTEGGAGGLARAFPQFPAPVLAPAIPAPVRPLWITAVGPAGNFAGGGGGGESAAPGAPAIGGGAGAGSGAEFPGIPATAAVQYTGSGGGGGTRAPVGSGGSGGDGIVIFRYPTT